MNVQISLANLVLRPTRSRTLPSTEYHWPTAAFGEQKRRSHRRAAATG
jgi:hypothetical protein